MSGSKCVTVHFLAFPLLNVSNIIGDSQAIHMMMSATVQAM